MSNHHANTRSSTRNHPQPRPCNQPQPPSSHHPVFPTFTPTTQQQPSPSSLFHGRDESISEGKRRRLNKGKNKVVEEGNGVEDEPEIVIRDGILRTLFHEPSKSATKAGLHRVRMTKHESTLVTRVLPYSIHGGRYYPKSWLLNIPSLRFFVEFLEFQGWGDISRFSGPIYPIEVVQFYATVKVKGGVLHAVVNGVDITVNIADFCSAFSIPHDGVEINPSQEWCNVGDDQNMIIKKYFNEHASENSNILVSLLAPKLKVSRRGGRDKVSSYEAIILFLWLEGRKVNLACLVFNRIVQTSITVTKEKYCTTLDLPYGMWISRLLKIKKVVSRESYGVSAKDGMCDRVMKLMGLGLGFEGPELVFSKSNEKGISEVGMTAMEAKLDSFMGSIMEKLEEQTAALAAVVSGVGQGSKIGGVSDARFVAWMKGIDSRLKSLERGLVTVRNEVISHGDRLTFLASQGGALVKNGKVIKADMDLTLEATKALSLKVLNFETSLNAQATHVRSCFDRLDSLEFRTRPGYVNPNNIHHP